MKITCFLPCRKGSERVPKKNIRPFANYSNGLIEIKLRQLSKVEAIDEILLSTNDDEIIKFAKSIEIRNLHIHRRNDELSSSKTSTDELITLASGLISDGDILWTHVTSPFMNSATYERIIKEYKDACKQGFDSLMTASLIRNFVWDKSGPLNYDRDIEKWPRTQTIEPLYEINSAAFICSSDIYKELGDRIGKKPKLFLLNKVEGFDIDWPEEYEMAEFMLKSGFASV